MYEEDRQRALAMYSAILDETDDENGVLQLMVSPTRQAVNLARAYDAKERKLQVTAQSRGEDEAEEGEPAFVQVIEQVRAQAASIGIVTQAVPDEQFSLFEDAELDTDIFDPQALADTLPEGGEDAPAELPEEPDRYPDEDSDVPAAPIAVPVPAGEIVDAPAVPAEEADDGEAEAFADDVDAFMADFSIDDEQLPDPVEDTVPAVEPTVSPAPAEAAPVQPVLPVQDTAPAQAAAPLFPARTVRKPRVFLLILFILIAVPVTLACTLILLVPAAASLGVAAAAIFTGVSALIAAFGSFSVFADILLVLGCAVSILALGLLFAWLFIWLLFGVIGGLIRGVCALGRKWCYKEVAAE